MSATPVPSPFPPFEPPDVCPTCAGECPCTSNTYWNGFYVVFSLFLVAAVVITVLEYKQQRT